jgi:tRNA A-37 threonylcarbamoyl transferase component Bud32
MTDNEASIDRGLGRVEARVADLAEQIAALRKELSSVVHTMESAIAGHRERLAALEAFRRWMIGLLTGVFLSGVAAVFGYWLKP